MRVPRTLASSLTTLMFCEWVQLVDVIRSRGVGRTFGWGCTTLTVTRMHIMRHSAIKMRASLRASMHGWEKVVQTLSSWLALATCYIDFCGI